MLTIRLLALLFLVVLLSPSLVHAQLVINEFSAMTSSDDWVEIYNCSDQAVDLIDYFLIDEADNREELSSCQLSAGGAFVVSWGNRLNNGGDRFYLMSGGAEIDCVAYNSGPACSGETVDISGLNSDEYPYARREPEGTGDWIKSGSETRADNAACVIIPSPTPIPAPSPTATPTDSSPTATYKINEVKDEGGNALSNVKIFVDGTYLHHYAPETLTFGNDCQCDGLVDCGFGEHTVKLEKAGFQDWVYVLTVEPGGFYEPDNLVMAALVVETETPSPAATSTPRLLSPTPKVTVFPTDARVETSPPTATSQPPPTQTAENNVLGARSESPKDFLPLVFIGGGCLLLGSAFLLVRKDFLKKVKKIIKTRR